MCDTSTDITKEIFKSYCWDYSVKIIIFAAILLLKYRRLQQKFNNARQYIYKNQYAYTINTSNTQNKLSHKYDITTQDIYNIQHIHTEP